MSKISLLGAGIGGILMFAAWVAWRRQEGALRVVQFRAKSSTLCSDVEQVLLHRLREAFPGHLVFAEVSMNQLVSPAGTVNLMPSIFRSSSADKAKWRSRFAAINGKSLDFLVCTLDTAPVLAIELDDASHSRASRKASDFVKNKALGDCGIRLERFSTTELPNVERLQTLLNNPLESNHV